MILSWYSAVEFAESLRIAVKHYANNPAFEEMARGELKTNNLNFEDYHRVGDHSEFLEYFIKKYGLLKNCPQSVIGSGERYLLEIRKLPDEIRIMSIVSREQELPGIFSNILKAPEWTFPALAAFQYYLRQHIELDSMEGGHVDLLKDFTVDNCVSPFYELRLDMYRIIPKLF